MFFRTPFILPLLYAGLTWRIPTAQKEIYLTFDDGPVSGPTEFALEKLHEHRALATFFCIGDNIRKNPQLFQHLAAQRHAIGNHTFNHMKGWAAGVDEYRTNVDQCQQEMLQHAKDQRKLFRPPYGKIKRSQIKSLADYQIIMWDVLTYDFRRSLLPDQCLKRSLAAIRPGSIVVFHDSYKAEKNMTYVLPRLLDHFSGQNYSFKSL